MSRTHWVLLAASVGLLSMSACSGNDSPIVPRAEVAALPPTYALQDGGESLVGMFTMTLDPVTLETTVTPIR
ncbi:MAG: hypothetical protein ABI743_12455, partial [bacterium]